MSTAINDITGDTISTSVVSQEYRDNYDAIFSGNKRDMVEVIQQSSDTEQGVSNGEPEKN